MYVYINTKIYLHNKSSINMFYTFYNRLLQHKKNRIQFRLINIKKVIPKKTIPKPKKGKLISLKNIKDKIKHITEIIILIIIFFFI